MAATSKICVSNTFPTVTENKPMNVCVSEWVRAAGHTRETYTSVGSTLMYVWKLQCRRKRWSLKVTIQTYSNALPHQMMALLNSLLLWWYRPILNQAFLALHKVTKVTSRKVVLISDTITHFKGGTLEETAAYTLKALSWGHQVQLM